MRQNPASQIMRYDPAFERDVNIREYARPMMSDEIETAQTVYKMDELADEDAAHRLVVEATRRALTEAGIDQTAEPVAKAIGIYWWLKRNIRYVDTPATSALVDQTLIPPASLLAMPEPEGDCPQFSMLASAMLRVCCIPSFFVTIAADPAINQYSHIYNSVCIGPGVFLPFDSSNGPAPGAEYGQYSKKKVWRTTRGYRCDATRGGSGDSMTYNAPVRSLRNTVLRRRIAGTRPAASYSATGHLFHPLQGVRLGQVSCDEDGNCYDADTGDYTPAPISLADVQGSATQGDCAYGMDAAGNCLGGSTALPLPLATVTSQTTGPSAAQSLTTALAIAAGAAAPAIAAASRQSPYYVTNPLTGQSVLYNPNTNTTSSTGIFGTSAGGTSSLLLLGLLGAGLLMLTHK